MGGLSFKNKIDLLFDLEILDNKEHKQFLLLMEFRNQFLHNIHCSSFVYAVYILGDDKKNSLLKFSNIEGEDEDKFINAYKNLYINNLHVARGKIQIRKDLIDEKSTLLITLNSHTTYFINFLFDMIVKLFEKYEKNDSDSPEIQKLKEDLYKNLEAEMSHLSSSEQYKHLKNKLVELSEPDKLKRFFK